MQEGPSLRVVPVVHRRGPRATRTTLTSDAAARAGGTCAPTGGTTRARGFCRISDGKIIEEWMAWEVQPVKGGTV